MHQTQYSNIVAFVEGSMERIFVNKNFPYVDLIPVSNGETWTVARLADQIASLYRAKNVFAEKVIVWIDREGRQETSEEIKQALTISLIDAGASVAQLAICVPDRMTENFILADEELVRAEFGLENYVYEGDGCNGKAKIKSMYKELSISYKETFHGANLLKKVKMSNSSENSGSSRSFSNKFDALCWWNR